MNEARQVTVLGTGRMGAAMAGCLRRAGFEVAVWNRTRSRAEECAREIGAEARSTPAGAVADADVVISSLADDGAVRDAYTGRDGAAAAIGPGTVAAEMSTIAPGTVREIRPAVEQSGGSLIDAPVSGSVAFAEKGELTIMAGGEAAALDRAKPVLDALSVQIFHVGELGAGATMKLAVNTLVHGLNVSLSEALVLAEKAGVERTTAYEVFAAGAGGAPFVHYKRAAFERPDETPVAFSLELVAKDLDLIQALAAEVGVRMDQAGVNRTLVRSAIDSGLGEKDLSAMAVFLRSQP